MPIDAPGRTKLPRSGHSITKSLNFKPITASTPAAPKQVGFKDQQKATQFIAVDEPQNNIVYKLSVLATRINFQPQLNFLNAHIFLNNKIISFKALIDTGCARTALSTKAFQKVSKTDTGLQLSQSNINIQTCDGTTHKIAGIVNLDIALGRPQSIKFNINIMVVEHLADDFLIGSDILNSILITKTTPKSIHLKDPQTGQTCIEDFQTTTFPN